MKACPAFPQAATAAAPPGNGSQAPREGDGFTFEHLADRKSIWIDFVADIGDGGDPTYAVASCLSAPTLLCTQSPEFPTTNTEGEHILISIPGIHKSCRCPQKDC